MLAAVYVATATQPAATAAVYGTISDQGLVQPGILLGATAQLSAQVAMYAETPPGVAVLAPAYLPKALQVLAPVTMYLRTAPPAVGPSGLFDPVYKLLDGGWW